MPILPERVAALAALRQLMLEKEQITFTISKADLWIILSTVQLALRHPRFNGPASQIARSVSDQLAMPLIANDRELALLWAMGKEPQFDDP